MKKFCIPDWNIVMLRGGFQWRLTERVKVKVGPYR